MVGFGVLLGLGGVVFGVFLLMCCVFVVGVFVFGLVEAGVELRLLEAGSGVDGQELHGNGR
ncbi:hypothetical protein [Pseudomonas syringae group genomosp. 7]|uniref:hypothetical protein n=1 Tax=Pseudomonas syringae group genomosp. 7 TaxID=251699 RepID=UPI0037701EFA